MTRIVNDGINMTVSLDDGIDGGIDRALIAHVQLDGPKVRLVLSGEVLDRLHLWRITSGGFTHCGVDRMPIEGEGFGGETAEATGRAGDYYYSFHDESPNVLM
jgi:hypothetical protein